MDRSGDLEGLRRIHAQLEPGGSEYELKIRVLELAGFSDVEVSGGLTDAPARAYDDTYVTFLASA